MKLGLVRHQYRLGGGAETVLALLGKELTRRGHSVHVITSRWQGEAPDYLELHQVSAHKKAAKWKRPWLFAKEVQQAAAGLGLDSWLSLERVPGAPVFRASDGCHAAWLERRSRYEPWLRRISFKLNPLHRSLRRLEIATVGHPQTRRVIAISQMVADELTRFCGLDPAKVRVIYNAVDQEALAPARDASVRNQARLDLALEKGRPVLLFLGSDFRRKGLGFAIKALADMPEAILLVAGREPPGPYEALARRSGLGARVRFLGLRADVAPLLAACDAFVLPTIYDPLSIAVMEALAAGVPAVTTSAAGASELIRPGQTGAVVDNPADHLALSRAMAQALALPKGFESPAPTIEQWLEQTLAVIEEAS